MKAKVPKAHESHTAPPRMQFQMDTDESHDRERHGRQGEASQYDKVAIFSQP